MVFKADLDSPLRQLRAIARRLGELAAWDDLAQWEIRPGTPPSFDTHTSARAQIRADIRALHGYFIGLSSGIRQTLHRHDLVCTYDDREQWRRQLSDLDEERTRLRISERFS